MALGERSTTGSNQPPPLEGYDLFSENRPLVEALRREGGGWAEAPEVADAFCASRLGDDGGRAYGTLPPGLDFAAIVDRHRPRVD